jgi:hypothetical protein
MKTKALLRDRIELLNEEDCSRKEGGDEIGFASFCRRV